MEKRKVTVSVFSKISKIPKATLYNLLAKEEYQKYITEESGVKRISLDLLEVLKQTNTSNSNKSKGQDKEKKEPLSDNGELERLRQEVQELKNTINEKDRQIAEFASRFADLASQAQMIAAQSQVLQLSDKEDLRELPAAKEEQIQEKEQEKQGFFRRLFKK